MNRLLFFLLIIASTTAAASLPVANADTEGFVVTAVDANFTSPEVRFCALDQQFRPLLNSRSVGGCVPTEKISAWSEYQDAKLAVPSVSAQEVLDRRFGKGVVRAYGSTMVSERQAMITYRLLLTKAQQ